MTNEKLFGFEIFDEIFQELDKLNDIYAYSNNNDAYNYIIELCKSSIREIAERKKNEDESNSKL